METPLNSFDAGKQYKDKKKHRTAQTSIDCFKEITANGQIEREATRVLKAIKEIQPCTARMIARHTGIAIGNITRSINDLRNKFSKVKIGLKAKCKETGITVQHYCLLDWKGFANG